MIDELAEAMRPFRREFVERSLRRLEEMEEALARLADGNGGADAYDAVRRHFHGLSGAGGSYGFPGVTALGLEGEAICRTVSDASRPASPAEIGLWRDLIRRLRGELADG